jgi:hypothetical protein
MTRSLEPPLARIGLFHFVENHRDPIGSLTNALSKHSDINRSLIVLPEAFNNGEVYYDQPSRQHLIGAGDILESLVAIARQRDLVLVAGLLEPPNNSAYLINKTRGRLMGHKQTNHDIDNPVEVGNACVSALICSNARDNYQRVMEKADKSTCAHKVICIPASMSSGTFDGRSVELPAYRNKYVILANSNPPPGGGGSFLANKIGRKVEDGNFICTHNAIFLAKWRELDDLGT